MDIPQVIQLVSTILPHIVAIVAVIVPALQARANRQREKDLQQFNFETVRQAQCKEAFLAAAANSLYLGVQFQDMQDLWNAYGQVSFYVKEETRNLMFEFCQLATKDKQKEKLNLYSQIVKAMQPEPPRAT